jgi:hypothetical protein
LSIDSVRVRHNRTLHVLYTTHTLTHLLGHVGFAVSSHEQQLSEAVAFVKKRLNGFVPSVALILGSGLGDLADRVLEQRCVIQYSEIPHFRQSKVHGHSNCLVAGKLNGANVIVQQVTHPKGTKKEKMQNTTRIGKRKQGNKFCKTMRLMLMMMLMINQPTNQPISQGSISFL